MCADKICSGGLVIGGDIKRRKSLPKKLQPTPMKGLKEIDRPKTQTKKNYDPPQRQNRETVNYK